MGEYATFNGEHVKIGTCESMYYLRWDQAHTVTPERGSLDPVAERDQLLFRFPWPWEDHLAPGSGDMGSAWGDRSFRVNARFASADGFEHGTVQLRGNNGYLTSIPCPEGADVETVQGSLGITSTHMHVAGLKIGLNGYGGPSELVAQRWWDGKLVAVVQCKGCGRMWRLPELEMALPILESIQTEVDRIVHHFDLTGQRADGDIMRAADLIEVGRRLMAGYQIPAEATA
jgi:hypothetical protein